MIDDKTLESILYLSRLDVGESEKENFRKQVGGILEYFDLLKNYDTSGVDVDLGNAVDEEQLRPDEPGRSYTEEELEKFAIHFVDNYFSTPRILDDFMGNKEE